MNKYFFPPPPHTDALSVEHVIALRKMGPVPEEVESFAKYKGDKTVLSDIDQFLMKMMEIPNFKSRLDLLLKIHEFPLQFDELAPETALGLRACKELRDSTGFEQVLLCILSVGNYVNGNTPKGAAHGIALQSLTKLSDARGHSKKKKKKRKKHTYLYFAFCLYLVPFVRIYEIILDFFFSLLLLRS